MTVRNLVVRYPGSSQTALEDISFELKAGERVAVVGPNGAGKSTLFKVIAGVLQPTAGNVRIYGQEPGRHVCIAYIPQRNQIDWTFPVTVSDVVMMGRISELGFLNRPKSEDWRYVHHCLDVVGIRDLANRQIGELSGGQQQRMFIARALAQEAELMLMDEPLSGLDVPAQEDIYRILDELRERGITVMVATHDLNQAAEYFDRVMLLNRRLLGFGRPAEVLSPDRLASAYDGHVQFVETADGMIILNDTCCSGGIDDG